MTPFHAAYIEKLTKDGLIADVLPRGRRVAEIEPYFYNVDFEGLDVDPTQQAILQTQADSDFVLTSMSAGGDTASIVFDPNAYWQIRDQASGKTFFNEPMHTIIFAGGLGAPGWLSAPRLILANSNLEITVQELETNTRLWLSLCGVRVFYGS